MDGRLPSVVLALLVAAWLGCSAVAGGGEAGLDAQRHARTCISTPVDADLPDTVESLISALRTALEDGDAAGMAKLASCDFVVGRPESGAGGPVDPLDFAARFIAQVDDLDWDLLARDELPPYEFRKFAEGSLLLRDPSGRRAELLLNASPDLAFHRHAFVFRSVEGGWLWSAYLTPDGALLERMWPGASP